MSTAKDILLALNPALASDFNNGGMGRGDVLLAVAENETGPYTEKTRPQAVALLTWHKLLSKALTIGLNGELGPVKSETEGQLSRTYETGSGSAKDDDLKSTAPGRQLLELRKATIFAPMVRSGVGVSA